MKTVNLVQLPNGERVNIVQSDCVLAGRHADAVWVMLAWSSAAGEILQVSLQEIYANMVAGNAFLALRHEDGCLVGYQTFGLWPEARIQEPRSKVVLPPYRQQGVGTVLSQAILEYMVQQRPEWLVLALASGGSVPIWKGKLGFVEVDQHLLPDCLWSICNLCANHEAALAAGKKCCAPALVWPGNQRGQMLIEKSRK